MENQENPKRGNWAQGLLTGAGLVLLLSSELKVSDFRT